MDIVRVPQRLLELVSVIVMCLTITACDALKSVSKITDVTVPDVTTQTTNALDDAINKLTQQSSQWQQVLQELTGKLTQEAQSTVRNEVATIASRSIAQAGVEFRCNADFVGGRVREALVRLKAKLLGGTIPPVEPGLCQVVPIAVDRESVPDHVKQIEFYGYDFDTSNTLKVLLERTAGAPMDVTTELDRPTHYAMTLKFGGNGVQLDDSSQRFHLEWNGKVISTIAVVQPAPKVCEVKTVSYLPQTGVTYVPPRVGRGDADFDGNGPHVVTNVSLITTPGSIQARVYMDAKETKSDWTEASGTGTFPLYTPEPGWQIHGLVSPSSTHHEYTDSNHAEDKFNLGSGGPVSRLTYVGDTDGDEAGTRTKVDVAFNTLQIELAQNTNCVSPQTLLQLHEKGLISERTFKQVEPEVRDKSRQQRGTTM